MGSIKIPERLLLPNDKLWIEVTVTHPQTQADNGRAKVQARAAGGNMLYATVEPSEIKKIIMMPQHVWAPGDKALTSQGRRVVVKFIDEGIAWCLDDGSGMRDSIDVRRLTYVPA